MFPKTVLAVYVLVVLIGLGNMNSVAEAEKAPHQVPSKPWEPKMSFEKAAKPYSDYGYGKTGYVDFDGKVKYGLKSVDKDNKERIEKKEASWLGCSAYASIVLHRMRYGYGNDWAKNYSLEVHKWFGDQIALHFGLKGPVKLSPAMGQSKNTVAQEVTAGRLKNDGLYFFNVRKEEEGHVGFIRIRKDGSLEQWHYSGMKAYKGLATGDFRKWYNRSRYKRSDVELYLIPELNRKNTE